MSAPKVPPSIREPLRLVLLERQEQRIPFALARPASVLLPLVARGDDVCIWLIKRAETLAAHGGQVALPGGKRDPDDRDSMVTAVRETEEELGFPSHAIEMLGRLDDVPTSTGFVITPYVGWMREDLTPVPSPHEIARAFCAPVATFAFQRPRPNFFRGKGLTRIAPGWEVDGEIVWGATGRILATFADVVREALRRHRL